MKTFILLVCIGFLFDKVNAQLDYYQAGARSKSIADASVSLSDRWSGFNNPAAQAFLKEISTGVYLENYFNIRQLNSCAFILNYHPFSLNIYSFNNSSVYRRQRFGLAYALAFSKTFSMGISLDLIHTYVSEYGGNLSFCGEAGLFYMPVKKLSVGIYLNNPTLAKYSGKENEKIPVSMRIGLAYKMTDFSVIVIETQNSSVSGFACKAGLEYNFLNDYSIRLGFRSNPMVSTFGLAFRTKNLVLDMVLQYQQILDVSPGVSMDYIFKKF